MGGQTCADEVATLSVPKVVEDFVAVRLGHARVDEETRVAQLSDLLGQELHSLHRVAEYDALVDLELRGGGGGGGGERGEKGEGRRGGRREKGEGREGRREGRRENGEGRGRRGEKGGGRGERGEKGEGRKERGRVKSHRYSIHTKTEFLKIELIFSNDGSKFSHLT